MYLLMALVLLLRPRGLFGERIEVRVDAQGASAARRCRAVAGPAAVRARFGGPAAALRHRRGGLRHRLHGLNILVGNTGLVSFGHGAWFGLGAYAAALSQRHWFPGDIILPTLFAILFVAVAAALSGALILRRRGVYFSLLTLALTALLFAIGYRWTEFTGGERARRDALARARRRPRT